MYVLLPVVSLAELHWSIFSTFFAKINLKKTTNNKQIKTKTNWEVNMALAAIVHPDRFSTGVEVGKNE